MDLFKNCFDFMSIDNKVLPFEYLTNFLIVSNGRLIRYCPDKYATAIQNQNKFVKNKDQILFEEFKTAKNSFKNNFKNVSQIVPRILEKQKTSKGVIFPTEVYCHINYSNFNNSFKFNNLYTSFTHPHCPYPSNETHPMLVISEVKNISIGSDIEEVYIDFKQDFLVDVVVDKCKKCFFKGNFGIIEKKNLLKEQIPYCTNYIAKSVIVSRSEITFTVNCKDTLTKFTNKVVNFVCFETNDMDIYEKSNITLVVYIISDDLYTTFEGYESVQGILLMSKKYLEYSNGNDYDSVYYYNNIMKGKTKKGGKYISHMYFENNKNNKCGNNSTNCVNKTYAIQCKNGYFMNMAGSCIKKQFCKQIYGGICVELNGFFHYQKHEFKKSDELCLSCSFNECFICESNSFLINGKCQLKGIGEKIVYSRSIVSCADGHYNNQNTLLKLCPDHFLLSENGKYLTSITKCAIAQSDNCELLSPIGCLRCAKGYYTDKENKCSKCNTKCTECTENSEKCHSCITGTVLSNGKCLTIFALEGICTSYDANGQCSQCINGYSTTSGTCVKCPYPCVICKNDQICEKCDNTYFMNETEVCESVYDITNCGELSETLGCLKCSEGYYKSKLRCIQCKQNCSSCNSADYCNECSNNMVLSTGKCTERLYIEHCILITNSMCKKYNFWYESSTDMISCDKINMTKILLIVIFGCIFLLIIFTIPMSFVGLYIIQRHHLNVERKKKGISSIRSVREQMKPLIDNIYTTSSQLDFGVDLPVNRMSTKTVIFANKSKSIVKLQLVYMHRKSYKITVSLKVVTLRPKDASLSTWIDDSSITDMIEICRGGVGIIFKATYKGRTVAVKKIRQFKNVKDDEFTTEVDIANNVQNTNEKILPQKIRYKILLDATKGVNYLHLNGIFHRDIKPGNILVVELNSIIEVNAKLSDFVSARNENLLMSNLTFTKGVGTPKYMAPELLNGQKYSIAANVYSLGITFFEAFTWKDAFEDIKYFFEIPELISKGKRPDDKCLSYKERRLLEEMWAQKMERKNHKRGSCGCHAKDV
ncbi:protein serine/threonine kinase, putative [Entamoeba invadens IP1]|uniref:Protein serine/threonine kinase, putative n=1 Tax=Entamoeba invadens IP1 TaxID=370355 RepID=A0A0A1UBG6_ENTIV|nr:protein serine/threonine kinase, putative [Entamoeba invadens IP1]ELP92528.1 protein serine/threonine kinase, putative [Entamoeba invadens IP1]|eukprot:XP_004259299.1 protein serine/threonine kinase, putative [Entamoeba invadens IP1]